MRIKLSLKKKLQVYIISITALLLMAAIYYVSYKVKHTAIDNAKSYTEEVIAKYSKQIELKLNTDLTIIRTLAQAEQTFSTLDEKTWKPLFANMYSEVLSKNEQFDDLWDSWELYAIDENWDKPYGRYCLTAYNESPIRITEEIKSLDGDPEQYARIKLENKENIEEPYMFSFTGKPSDEVLITDMTVPIRNSKMEYLGLVGADIRLEKLQEIVNKIKPYKNSIAYLISYKGVFTSHPNSEHIGQEAKGSFPEIDLIDNIQKGEDFSFTSVDANGAEYYNIFHSIHIGNTQTPWSIGVKVPLKSIVADANRESWYYMLVGISIIIFLSIVIAIIAQMITNPLIKITNILQDLSIGNVNKDMITEYKSGDEIEAISNALNRSINSLMDKTKFAEKIGKNEYDAKLKLLSDSDTLGHSLLNMQSSLIEAKQLETNRQNEDKKRQWANEGLAKFADIFRNNNDSIQELSSIFTREIVNYNSANQGSLFLEVDGIYQSIATFAYDRDKFNKMEIAPGEGLLGNCILEKKSAYFTDIPQGYVKITSGLGEATATSLFICPIQTDNSVVGVLEIASFQDLDEVQRNFIETICTNFASVVESVKISDNTKILLEQTQQQAEELKAQEEEMRQNLEELQTTQEEIAQKSSEMNGILNALNSSSLVYTISMDGKLIEINQTFLNVLDTNKEELIGKDIFSYSNIEENFDFQSFWTDLREGKTRKEEHKLSIPNCPELWLSEVYSTIFNESNEAVSIMCIATDITARKVQEAEIMQQNEEMSAQEEEMRQNLEELQVTQEEIAKTSNNMQGILNAMDESTLVLKLNFDGSITDLNPALIELLGLPKENLITKNHKEFTNIQESDYDLFWENLRKGIPQKNELHLNLSNGKELWLSEVYTTIFDENSNPVSVINIAYDITNIKKQEIALAMQNEEMSAQEEEMRQSLEELEVTQEEIAKTSSEMQGILNAIDVSTLSIRLDLEGKIIDANSAIIELLEVPKEALLGKNLKDFATVAKDEAEYKLFWENLRNGIPQKDELHITLSTGKELWLSEVYSTIFDENNNPVSILNIAYDITRIKSQEIALIQQNEEMAAQEEMMLQTIKNAEEKLN